MTARVLAFGLSLLSLTAVAAEAWAGAAGHAASTSHPVLVELFTSQGCSDCPEADRILGELAQRQDIIALTLPITYWDMLGWKDTFATETNTLRQKSYARTMRRSGIYTPQMIVDGLVDVVGNQREHVLGAVAARSSEAARQEPVRMMVTAYPGRVIVDIAAMRARGGRPEATVWIMRTLSHANVAVQGGENRNRQLAYTNVVRELRRAGEWNGRAVTLDVPLDEPREGEDGLAVILQSHEFGAVLSAALVLAPPAAPAKR
jgi:hypothetical protein